MRRFFINARDIVGGTAKIIGDEAYHIIKVLRLGPGTSIIICDGEGYEYKGDIASIDSNTVIIKILGAKKTGGEPGVKISLAQALSRKSANFEFVIQKAVELGVNNIVPLLTDRTVVRAEEDRFRKRRKRWQRIALEAAKQSRRGRVPAVEKPSNLQDFLERLPRDTLCLMPWEGEDSTGIGEILKWESSKNFIRPVALLIGPEGGFTPEEVDNARRSGAIPVSLGPRILRTETAGIIALGIVLYELGDLGGAKFVKAQTKSGCTSAGL
ncbi:MAG: 16S rRNA (uracil(1498)-N(3))-methyltransferase [Clostridia bacterium]|nr:16S rRNA (uracil(1498)-N(3))-methyltransferase [Clostridia bacterium]